MIDALGQQFETGDFVAIGVGAGVISVGLVVAEVGEHSCKVKISSATRKYVYGTGVNGYQERAVLKSTTTQQKSVIRIEKDHISKIEIQRPWWVVHNTDKTFKEAAEQLNMQNLMILSRDIKKRKYEQNQKAHQAAVS